MQHMGIEVPRGAAVTACTRRAAITTAVCLALTACGQRKTETPGAAVAVVPTVTAVTGTVFPQTVLAGIIAPFQNVGITSALSESAIHILVREGDTVRRGQVLAQLDTADLRAELAADIATASSDRAKATQTYDQANLTIVQNANSVNQARAAVRQAQQTLAADALNLRRDTQLLQQGYIAQQQYDAQKLLVRNDRQAVSSAEVALDNDVQQVRANGTTATGLQGSQVAAAFAATGASQAQARQIQLQIANATIVSPIDGVVVNRNLNPGEFPGTRQIFAIQETKHVYAVLNGGASQIASLQPGSPATIIAGSLPGKRFTGTVEGLLNPLDPGSTNYVVKVLLSNPRQQLRPGMPVSGMVRLAASTGVLVPVTAFLDTTDGSVQIVRDNVIETAVVTMLAQDGSRAAVSGLSPGTTVVANGQLGLNDGQTVVPQQVAAASRGR